MTVVDLIERLEQLNRNGKGDQPVFVSSDPEGNSITPLYKVTTEGPDVVEIDSGAKTVFVLWPKY